ncbi:TPA: 4Fe-4S cluster-binding domain-containing protein [Vibrio parahaemolyticus]|nr:4Fe-4S cluster-binding domain-containing protein [Vibrio parahaemolyticus]
MIDTNKLSSQYRRRILKEDTKQVLIANLYESIQSQDSDSLVNCCGYGRVREFFSFAQFLNQDRDGIGKPLWRGEKPTLKLRSQTFQLAACNWRCWYCFVEDGHLSANKMQSEFMTSKQLIDLYLNEVDRAKIIDLSGGQPFIVPEWLLWMTQEVENRCPEDTSIWVDDNLSNYFLWKYLTKKDLSYLSSFRNLSIAGCFKGFDSESFQFNTKSEKEGFTRQLDIARRLIKQGFNTYYYVSLTSQILDSSTIRKRIKKFIDELQVIDEYLPLRVIPLKIYPFNTVKSRKFNFDMEKVLTSQHIAYEYWLNELDLRYQSSVRELGYDDINLNGD